MPETKTQGLARVSAIWYGRETVCPIDHD